MKCRDLEELLSAYADGELPRAQREFVEEHLDSCSQCQAMPTSPKKKIFNDRVFGFLRNR